MPRPRLVVEIAQGFRFSLVSKNFVCFWGEKIMIFPNEKENVSARRTHGRRSARSPAKIRGADGNFLLGARTRDARIRTRLFRIRKGNRLPAVLRTKKINNPSPRFKMNSSRESRIAGCFLCEQFSAFEKAGRRASHRKLRTVSAMPSRTETGRRSTPSSRLSFALETT